MPGPLDNTPAEIVAALIEGLGLHGAVYVGNEPDSPDEVVTVYDTAGVQQGRSMIDGERWEYYGIQVRVRAPLQRRAGQLAWLIATTLDTDVYDATVTIGETTGTGSDEYTVHAVQRTSGPIPLGKQEPTSRRSVFTINLLVGLERAT